MSMHENNNTGHLEAVTESPSASRPACSINILEEDKLDIVIMINGESSIRLYEVVFGVF